MKKKLLLPLFLSVLTLTGCSLIPTKQVAEVKEKTPIEITSEEMNALQKVSNLVFTLDKESLKTSDLPEEKKAEIARQLQDNYMQVTGTEMTKEFRKYFGEDQTVTFKNIDCGMDHGNEEENVLYIFDTTQDKYVYNDKHPGHGGGFKNNVNHLMEFEKVSIKDNEYHYYVKVLFYGKFGCPDAGACTYGKAYKNYNDAKNETNAIVEIDNNDKYVTMDYNTEMPVTHMDKVMEDVKSKLDTYEFIFIKENGNLVFQSYQKA